MNGAIESGRGKRTIECTAAEKAGKAGARQALDGCERTREIEAPVRETHDAFQRAGVRALQRDAPREVQADRFGMSAWSHAQHRAAGNHSLRAVADRDLVRAVVALRCV